MKPEITNRKDIELLVDTFYQRIREDSVLGPVFNAAIAERDWPLHLSKLSDFWESNLFGVPKFKGDPVSIHRKVDAMNEHSIGQAHFGHWIHLWFSTIDDLFEGDLANLAKERARKMASRQFFSMWAARPGNVDAKS